MLRGVHTVRLCQACRWQNVQSSRVQNVTSPVTKLPSRKLTYPTLGKGYVSSLESNSKRMEFVGTFLAWNVRLLRILRWSVAFLIRPAVGYGFKPLGKPPTSETVWENTTTPVTVDQGNAPFFSTCNSWQVCWYWQLQIYLLHPHRAIEKPMNLSTG